MVIVDKKEPQTEDLASGVGPSPSPETPFERVSATPVFLGLLVTNLSAQELSAPISLRHNSSLKPSEQRYNVANEMLETERSYLQILRMILRVWGLGC